MAKYHARFHGIAFLEGSALDCRRSQGQDDVEVKVELYVDVSRDTPRSAAKNACIFNYVPTTTHTNPIFTSLYLPRRSRLRSPMRVIVMILFEPRQHVPHVQDLCAFLGGDNGGADIGVRFMSIHTCMCDT